METFRRTENGGRRAEERKRKEDRKNWLNDLLQNLLNFFFCLLNSSSVLRSPHSSLQTVELMETFRRTEKRGRRAEERRKKKRSWFVWVNYLLFDLSDLRFNFFKLFLRTPYSALTPPTLPLIREKLFGASLGRKLSYLEMIDLRNRTKQLALKIIEFYSDLPKTTAQILGKQILPSGTSIGAHYREAFRSRSTAEYISKLEVGIQELEETNYWLELLEDAKIIQSNQIEFLTKEPASQFTPGP